MGVAAKVLVVAVNVTGLQLAPDLACDWQSPYTCQGASLGVKVLKVGVALVGPFSLALVSYFLVPFFWS